MKRLLICIALVLTVPGIVSAGNTAPSDHELFEELYSRELRELIPEHAPGSPGELIPVFEGEITPSRSTRSLTDAVLSARGYSITDSPRESASTLSIRITDARVTLRKSGGNFERHLFLTLHVRSTGYTGAVLFARGGEYSIRDNISGKLRKSTNTGGQFSPEIKRTVMGLRTNAVRIVSLLTLSATLGFFAIQK